MELAKVMASLRAMGTEQNRKVYARHGYGSSSFGVSFANLSRLARALGTDQALAEALWKTGNEDARILATLVADPETTTPKLLDAWAADARHYVLADVLARNCAGRSPHAQRLMERWTRSSDEWVGRAGWTLLAVLAMHPDGPQDRYLEAFLPKIERGIHRARNKTRDAMNNALIAIGLRGGPLAEKAVAAARRIGKVTVDHGDTSCRTPSAAEYIEKTLASGRGVRDRTARAKAAAARRRERARTTPDRRTAEKQKSKKTARKPARRGLRAKR